MRVISQKGIEPTVDLPYEQVVLLVDGKFITAIVPGRADMLIARYSTPEKAEKAMEMLWDEYQYSINAISEMNAIVYGGFFRFPEDLEV